NPAETAERADRSVFPLPESRFDGIQFRLTPGEQGIARIGNHPERSETLWRRLQGKLLKQPFHLSRDFLTCFVAFLIPLGDRFLIAWQHLETSNGSFLIVDRFEQNGKDMCLVRLLLLHGLLKLKVVLI